MFKLILTSNPYELDILKDIDKEIPALTSKNSEFIEAIISLDSNYGADSKEIEPGKCYIEILKNLDKQSPLSQKTDSDNYLGSTAFWFKEIERTNISSPKYSFSELLRGALININQTNSTRHSRLSVITQAENLYNSGCKNVQTLKEMLNIPFDSNNKDHILSILTKNETNADKCKLSLASKFCSYASEHLNGIKQKYSKYDSVVSANLKLYIDYYLGNDYCPKYNKTLDRNFSIPQNTNDRYQAYLDTYEAYSYFIERILKKLKNNQINLDRNKLDHIIWYAKK